jgi:hypothetical protein
MCSIQDNIKRCQVCGYDIEVGRVFDDCIAARASGRMCRNPPQLPDNIEMRPSEECSVCTAQQ